MQFFQLAAGHARYQLILLQGHRSLLNRVSNLHLLDVHRLTGGPGVLRAEHSCQLMRCLSTRSRPDQAREDTGAPVQA